MQYAPPISSNIGNILANAGANSAQTYMQGMQNFGQSIGKGLEKVGDSVGDALNDVRANAIKYDTAAGMLDTYKQNAEALGLDMQMLQGIEQKYANKPNELIGALTVVGKIGENNLDIQKAEKTYAALSNVYAGKASATAAAKAALPPKMNAENIRSMVSEAKAAGFTDDQIKTKLQSQYGDWAVRSVYPPQNQGIWMGQ